MPNVSDYEKEDDWMGACVPKMMDEGRDNDQAVAACMNMWREKKSFGNMSIEEAIRHFTKQHGGAHSGHGGAHAEPVAGSGGGEGGEGGGGSNGGRARTSRGFGSTLDEFRFVNRRLAAGNLKPGEQRMLERRAERLARDYYGVPEKSIKGMQMDSACAMDCQSCINDCLECIQICQSCPDANDEKHQACITACQMCIAACAACQKECESGNAQGTMAACQKCAEVCMQCVEACETCAACEHCKMACEDCSCMCGCCADTCNMNTGEMKTKDVKLGARNSRRDAERLQMIHDYSVENGAMCKKANGKSEPVEEMVAFGATIKAVKLDDGSVKFSGPLVSYGSPEHTDLTADYFDNQTDYGDVKESDVYFNHRLPIEVDGQKIEYKQRMGRAQLIQTDEGIIAEVILKARNAYEKAIIDAGLAGALGWSSGTAGHLVEREPIGKAYHIKSWPLGLDASLTPTPAEPRNSVIPLKSLAITPQADRSDTGANTSNDKPKESTMDKDELKALLAENNQTIVETVKTEAKAAAIAAVNEELDKLPEVKARLGNVHVELDEADRPFRNVAEQLLAVKNLSSGRVDPRMKRIQAISHQWMEGNEEAKALLGSNEVIPSQGEFLLEPTISAEFLKPLHDEGPITKLARRMPVGPNSSFGWINGVDETSRATGSRWGGVRGYWLSAGDSMTASQPKFRRINWELSQLAVLQYCTDNMLKDSQLMDSVIRQSALEELNFLVNDAFFRGTGAGQPKGLGTAGTNPALISAVRTDATNIDHADITRMVARIPARAHSRMVWLANPDIMPELDTLNFTAGTTGILSPYVTYTSDGVTMLRGRPVVYNEFSPTLGSVGDLLLWDPQDYLYWEGAGVEGASSIHVQFLTNQTVFRFIYRVDGMPASYSAMTRYQSTDTESAYVALAATT